MWRWNMHGRVRGLTLALTLVLALGVGRARADMACDGTDDDLRTGLAVSTFLSSATGTIMLSYTPTGASSTNDGSTECYSGGLILANYEKGVGTWFGIGRHVDFESADQLVVWHYDGAPNCTAATYTTNVRTHLTWVHSGGSLVMYKDGVFVESVAAGDTPVMAGTLNLCVGEIFEDLEIDTAVGTVSGLAIFPTALSAGAIANAAAGVHGLYSTAPSGAWPLDDCALGASGDGVTFVDRSGNGRHLTGSNGPNDTGLTCGGNARTTYAWGPE